MDKKLKILIIVAVILGIVSLAFLMLGKKSSTQNAGAKNNSLPVISSNDQIVIDSSATPQKAKKVKKQALQNATKEMDALLSSQWQKCKDGSTTGTTLFWKIGITEGIPTGGTYAKGNVNSKQNLPVRLTVKAGSPLAEKIKAKILVGTTVAFRGVCKGATPDGSIVLFEAY